MNSVVIEEHRTVIEHHARAAGQAAPILGLPPHWPAQTDLLSACMHMNPGMAALLVLLGLIYLLFGFNIYKALVMLNAIIVGAVIGAALGERAGAEAPMAIVGAFVAAAITWPLMKWAVAVMGGLFGAMLGASIWRLCELDPHFAWAGALIGLMTLGLLSFILFRGCVMMYTSLQGAVMLIFGLLGLVYKSPAVHDFVTEHMRVKPFVLPLAIFIPAIVGLIFQQHNGATPVPVKK